MKGDVEQSERVDTVRKRSDLIVMNEANLHLMLRSSVISQGHFVVSFASSFISGPIKVVFKIHKKSIHRT